MQTRKIQIRNSELDQKTWRCEMPTNWGEKKKKNKTEEKETSQKWRQAVAIRESDKYKRQRRSNIHIRWTSVSLKVVNKAIREGGRVWKTTGLAFLKTQRCERNRWVTVLDFKKLRWKIKCNVWSLNLGF